MTSIKRLLLIGIATILFTSCNFIDEPHYDVDPWVIHQVDKFFIEARNHGLNFGKPNMIVYMVHGLEKKENATGSAYRCSTDIHIIEFDYDVLKYWHDNSNKDGLDSLRIERLVFHEMGHSILYRKHVKTYSIMNNNDYFEDYLNSEKRQILLDELFKNR